MSTRTVTLSVTAAATLGLVGLLVGEGLAPDPQRPTRAAPAPGVVTAPLETELGAAPFALERVVVEPVEPFVMRRGPEAGQVMDRQLAIHGRGFYGTARGPWVMFDGVAQDGLMLRGDGLVTVYLAEERRGTTAVTVRLPDGREAAMTAEF